MAPSKKIAAGLIYLLGLYTLASCFNSTTDSGAQLYTERCAGCHMDDGRGLRKLIPPLAQADYLRKHRQDLPCLIQHGITGSIVVNGQEYNKAMPGAETLPADQVTNLLNYVQTNFGNNNERFTIPEVAASLDACSTHQH